MSHVSFVYFPQCHCKTHGKALLLVTIFLTLMSCVQCCMSKRDALSVLWVKGHHIACDIVSCSMCPKIGGSKITGGDLWVGTIFNLGHYNYEIKNHHIVYF